MGNELSGAVDAVGPGVMRFAKGDRVFARVDKDVVGAFAEYTVVHEDHAARMPASLDFPSAAAVPLAALTALQALRDELQLSAGHRVFIPGGGGGVGTFAIQIAKHLGAHVATTTSLRGEALVKRLGADVVIDYLASASRTSCRATTAPWIWSAPTRLGVCGRWSSLADASSRSPAYRSP
jgi:NADPH:quinone reductase-like Zn-dependent oxidoreductase